MCLCMVPMMKHLMLSKCLGEYFISSQSSRWIAICLDDLPKLNIYANPFLRIVNSLWHFIQNQQLNKRYQSTLAKLCSVVVNNGVYHVSAVSTCIPYKSILFHEKSHLICKFRFLENSNSVNLHSRFTFNTHRKIAYIEMSLSLVSMSCKCFELM